jgi:hypothetical protein
MEGAILRHHHHKLLSLNDLNTEREGRHPTPVQKFLTTCKGLLQHRVEEALRRARERARIGTTPQPTRL